MHKRESYKSPTYAFCTETLFNSGGRRCFIRGRYYLIVEDSNKEWLCLMDEAGQQFSMGNSWFAGTWLPYFIIGRRVLIEKVKSY